MSTLVSVTKFSDDKLQKAIDDALVALPADKSGALVAHADLSAATLTVVERLGSHWTIRAGAIYPYGGVLTAEAEVVASW